MLTLSWTMLLEIVCQSTHVHSRTIKIYDSIWDGAYIVMDDTIWNRLQKYAWPTPGPSESMIIAETVLTLSWTLLFGIVCKCTYYSLQDHLWLWLRRCLHWHGRCYLKSFANVRISHSRTIEIYDSSWDSAYIVMDDASWNRLQTYTLPTPGPSTSMIIAEMVHTLSWAMLFEIVRKCTHYPLQDL